MLESQIELKESIGASFAKFKTLMPEFARPYEEMNAEAYGDGTISARNKRLMAMTAAIVSGCRGCILFQSTLALELGAGKEEILEACAVAVSLGGTMAAGESTRLIRLLEEKELL